MKLLKRTLVLLLCLATLLPFSLTAKAENVPTPDESTTETTPASVYASDDMGQTAKRLPQEDTVIADDNAALAKPKGVEVVSQREENVKHFDMGDGTYQAIAYSHPVHEQDSDGNWQDIDFGMKLTQTRGVSTYTNTAGTTFAANYVANRPIMSMSGEDTSIDMTFIYAKEGVAARAGMVTTAVAEVTQAETAMETYADAQNANFSNRLFYENVMPGVDLEYIVDPWNVKENIIVKEKAGNYVYVFKLNLNGLYPVLHTDGSVFLLNEQTDEREYVIPAPYMYDAYGEMSFDVNYTVTGSNGTWYLTVTADNNWINVEDRAFPITIDPSIYTANQSVYMDTYINEDTPNEPRGLYKFFFVGENEVAYLYAPTPDLPEGAGFKTAALKLHYFYKDHITTGYVDFTAHRVTDFYWAQESLTWNDVVNNPDYENFGLTPWAEGSAVRVYANKGATSASPKPVSVNITDAVRQWTTGTTNIGIGLKIQFGCPNRSVMFRSTEGHVNYRPRLEYTYSLYTVNLILEYDEAYSVMHSGEASAQQRILGEAAELAQFFLDEFDIVVHYDTPTLTTTYADDCDEQENGLCACGGRSCYPENEIVDYFDDCHHTNLYAMLWGVPCPPENSVVIVYTGRDTCYYKDESNPCVNAYEDNVQLLGLADPDNYIMIIADRGDDEIRTVIHEMGHMFGTDDHYALDCPSTNDMRQEHPNDGYNEQCIYGENKDDMNTINDMEVCDGCRKRINAHRGDFCD